MLRRKIPPAQYLRKGDSGASTPLCRYASRLCRLFAGVTCECYVQSPLTLDRLAHSDQDNPRSIVPGGVGAPSTGHSNPSCA